MDKENHNEKTIIINDSSWASIFASEKDAAKAAIDNFIESVKELK